MTAPLGGNELLVDVKVQKSGDDVLPQATQEVVQFQQTMQNVTATTGNAAAQVVQLGAANERITQTAPHAERGLHMVRTAAAALAFEAAGVPGPLGRLSEGLLMLGGGSELMLGVVAGLGAVGVAARALSQDFRDDTAAIDDEIKQLGSMGAHADVVAERLKLTQLKRQREDSSFGTVLLRGAKDVFQAFPGGASFAEQDEEIKRQEAIVATAEARAKQTFESPREQTRQEANIGQRQAELRMQLAMSGASIFDVTEKLRVLELEQGKKYPAALAVAIAATERQSAELNDQAEIWRATEATMGEAAIRQNLLFASTERITEALRIYKLELRGYPTAAAAAIAANERFAQHQIGVANVLRDALPRAFEQIGQAAITDFSHMAQTIVGITTNVLQQLPGVSPIGGGIIGLFGSVLSGLFGGGGHKIQVDSYSSHALDQLKGVPAGPQRVELSIFSLSTGEIIDRVIYELGQRSRTDAVRRALPYLLASSA